VLRDELLNRPYLTLSLLADETRALITPAPLARRASQPANLYFSSGMEMQLECP
jgi:hypothetical protein